MFEKKPLAKERRKSLNGKTKEGEEIFDYVVTYGPDHDKFDVTTAKIKLVSKEVKEVQSQPEVKAEDGQTARGSRSRERHKEPA